MVSRRGFGVVGWIVIEQRPSTLPVARRGLVEPQTLEQTLGLLAGCEPVVGGRRHSARGIRSCRLARPASLAVASLDRLQQELTLALAAVRQSHANRD